MRKILTAIVMVTIMASFAFSAHAQGLGMGEKFQYRSRMQLDFDGVDERLSKTSPSWATDARAGGKGWAMWFEIDFIPTANATVPLIGYGGADGTGTDALLSMLIRTRTSAPIFKGRLDMTSVVQNSLTSGNYGSTDLFIGTRYFAVFQTNGTVYQMYLGANGRLAAETISQWVNTNTGNWYSNINATGTKMSFIGALYQGGAGGTAFPDARIDEIVYFNDDLTLAEARELYNGGVPKDPRKTSFASKVASYWKMGEGGENGAVTTIHDRAGSNDWTAVNMEDTDIQEVQYRPSDSAYNIDFDGVDERMSHVSPSFGSANTGSISFWFVTDSATAANSFQNMGGYGDEISSVNFGQVSFGLRRNSTGFPTTTDHYFEFIIKRAGTASTYNAVDSPTPITVGTTYLVVVTSDGATTKTYLNGIEQTVFSYTGSNVGDWFADAGLTGSSKTFALGSSYRNAAWSPINFNGRMDEFTVWNRDLTQAEVTELYAKGMPIDPRKTSMSSAIISYYPMGEAEAGSITTVNDVVGSNTVTSENMENADIQVIQ